MDNICLLIPIVNCVKYEENVFTNCWAQAVLSFVFTKHPQNCFCILSNGFIPCLCCGKVSRNPIGCVLSLVAFFFPSNLGGRNHAIIQWWFAWETCTWSIVSYFPLVFFAKKSFPPLYTLVLYQLDCCLITCLVLMYCACQLLSANCIKPHSKNNFRNAFTL